MTIFSNYVCEESEKKNDPARSRRGVARRSDNTHVRLSDEANASLSSLEAPVVAATGQRHAALL